MLIRPHTSAVRLPMARRYGFGEKTGETDSGLAQHSDGHVEISESAAKSATEQYPKESPAGAVALRLAEVGGVDLTEYADPDVDGAAIRDALTAVDGVGEETADDAVEALEEAL